MIPSPAGTDPARLPSSAPLMQLALAYRSSSVLFAALDLDMFTLLDEGPKDAEELAAACGAHVPALRLLLAACVAEGLLRADGYPAAINNVMSAPIASGVDTSRESNGLGSSNGLSLLPSSHPPVASASRDSRIRSMPRPRRSRSADQ